MHGTLMTATETAISSNPIPIPPFLTPMATAMTTIQTFTKDACGSCLSPCYYIIIMAHED
jgi:hypothetical protein